MQASKSGVISRISGQAYTLMLSTLEKAPSPEGEGWG